MNSNGAAKLEMAADGKSVKEARTNPQARNSFGGLIVLNGNLIFADKKFIVYGNCGDVSVFYYEKGILVPGGSFKINYGTLRPSGMANGVLYIRHGEALMAFSMK